MPRPLPAPVANREPKASAACPARASALLSVLLTACPGPENAYLPYPEPDFNEYQSAVQPIVRDSCGLLGCHGDPDRTLTLYAVDRLRAEASVGGAALDPDVLSDVELQWNYDAFRMRLLDETTAAESRLLLKCLDPAVGGIVHADDTVVFESRDDPGYVALETWIEGGL
jgi:hypothetical protein